MSIPQVIINSFNPKSQQKNIDSYETNANSLAMIHIKLRTIFKKFSFLIYGSNNLI